jgi:hypothetical protein
LKVIKRGIALLIIITTTMRSQRTITDLNSPANHSSRICNNKKSMTRSFRLDYGALIQRKSRDSGWTTWIIAQILPGFGFVYTYCGTLWRDTLRRSRRVWKKDKERNKKSVIRRRREKDKGKRTVRENEIGRSKENATKKQTRKIQLRKMMKMRMTMTRVDQH